MKLISAIHRWAGAFLGLVLALLGLTGAILVWEGAWVMLPGAGVSQRERTEIKGLELAASYRLGSGLRIGGAFAALEGRYDSDGDDVVDRDLDGRNIAPDRLNLYAEAPIAGGLSARVQASHLFDRRFDGGAPRFDFDGYTLLDAIVTYDAAAAGRFTLGVANLLDEQYITYTSQTANFINNRNYSSGRGRAFTLRWQGSF